ncbi:MMPL family transporter [Mycolicibacterium sp.]|uniref:MMPL family transporter n=1 Tax=Mycolicibacterium sp. TaxID=2320850 RepID=UPI001DFDDAA0|nr:MMPL family transporter [Mycolicibacterium sp.]MCB1292111.1 MMPL family transporter [Mycobacterium sp.]MCB9410327.1 MMPL family transporter [Mycolicibacterium sp.]
MLARIARLGIEAPRRVLTSVALIMLVIGAFGVTVADELSPSGFQDPGAESSRAAKQLTEKFGQGDVPLAVVVTAPDRFDSPRATAVAQDVIGQLKGSGHVAAISSAWTSPPAAAAALVSQDRKSGLIVTGVVGTEAQQQEYTKALTDAIDGERDGVLVRSGGTAMVNLQVTEQSKRDLLVLEAIVVPLSFLVLVWVFGGLFAAALPVAVGVMAILGALGVLRTVTFFTDVSIFALNLTTAMGLALAIDYTLLMISRYRDELAGGADREQAILTTMATAGRTVLFSAVTVALSMAVMVLFPMNFLRSFAYAGVATVAFAALAAVIVTPAAIMLLGDRLNSLDVRRLVRRLLGRPEPAARPWHEEFWYRSAKFVMRRAVPIGLAGVALLALLGAPFFGVRPGFPDDRVLPKSASAHQVGDLLRDDFPNDSDNAVSIVVDSAGLDPAEVERYGAELSRVTDVTSVSSPSGTFINGNLVGPPVAATGVRSGATLLTVGSRVQLFTPASEAQLDRLHAVPTPGDHAVEFGGLAQTNRDSVAAITSRLPLVLGLIAVIMLVLLFLLTGSVVLPVKALILNMLSLSAAFGAMVWVFQDGNLGGLGTTTTGTLVANMPVLLFCIAFGLSMDYEVFLVSRIREFWLASGQGPGDSDESVALGLARTGRVITAAALIMAITFAGLVAAKVALMRLFGVGLTLAVLMDATLVRLVLVPAFMHVMGKWNWWAPAPLRRLHDRFGISESGHPATPAGRTG